MNYKMTNQNELSTVNTATGEIMDTKESIVTETDKYTIVKLEDGSFKKNMKYTKFFSRVPETEEDQIELYKVFNDSESGLVTPLRNMVGKEITIAHIFTAPYQSFDEKSGTVTNGVTTTIQDVDGQYYATSSKSVYHTLQSIMETFGTPGTSEYKPLKVNVTGTKRQMGVQIDLTLIGRA